MAGTSTKFIKPKFIVIRSAALPSSEWMKYINSSELNLSFKENDYWNKRVSAAKVLFEREDIKEAFFLASPNLTERLRVWNWEIKDDQDKKLLLSFDRYFNRICFRATPFGTFAAISCLNLSSSSEKKRFNSSLLNSLTIKKKYTLDSEVQFQFAHQLVKSIPYALPYVLNSSAYVNGETIQFVDWQQGKFGGRSYSLSEVSLSTPLKKVLLNCKNREFTFAELTSVLVEYFECNEKTASEFLIELISAKLFLPNIFPKFVGEEATIFFKDKLKKIPEAAQIYNNYTEVSEKIAALSEDNPVDVLSYIAVEKEIRSIFGDIRNPLCVQVDSYKKFSENEVNDEIFLELTSILATLIERFSRRKNLGYERIKEQFHDVYEDEMVQLVSLINDERIRVGWNEFFSNTSNSGLERISEFDQLLIKKIINGEIANNVLQLNDSDINEVKPKKNIGSNIDCFAILSEVFSEPTSAHTAKYELIDCLGMNPVSWLTRFAYGDEDLSENLQNAADYIKQSDTSVVHAEVIFVPSARFGNVMRRPKLWDFQIDLVESTPCSSTTISVTDLWVKAVKSGFEIWSRSLGKQVIPHVTSAQNHLHEENTSIYKFLRAVENQNIPKTKLSWGKAFSHLDFLPRIEYKNLILSPARWIISEKVVFENHKNKNVIDTKILEDFLRDKSVPEWVKIEEGDNGLILNTKNPIDLAQISKVLAKSEEIYLREVFDVTLTSKNKPDYYHHEIIVPLLMEKKKPDLKVEIDEVNKESAKKMALYQGIDFSRYLPLNEVIYVKIYLHPMRLDAVMIELKEHFLENTAISNYIKKWFFVRYSDPGYHLRLRIFCEEKNFPVIVQNLVQRLELQLQSKSIQMYKFDLFQPEYFRYQGTNCTNLSNELFHLDSLLTLNSIALNIDKNVKLTRWKIALINIDRFLKDAGLDFADSLLVIAQMAHNFSEEFEFGSTQYQYLGSQFRKNREFISSCIAGIYENNSLIRLSDDYWKLIRKKRKEILAACFEDQRLQDENWISNGFLASHIHMMCNRLIPDSSRKHEAYIYVFLEKEYRSLVARNQSRNTIQNF